MIHTEVIKIRKIHHILCQVKSKTGSDYSGAYRYSIELYDTTGTSTINMSHELVFLGRALGSQDCIQVYCMSSILKLLFLLELFETQKQF